MPACCVLSDEQDLPGGRIAGVAAVNVEGVGTECVFVSASPRAVTGIWAGRV